MGNCQTVDAAALVIQHPSGKQERMYWPVTASEVMKTNPGHYVSLIIPLPTTAGEENSDEKTVRYTSVKLLRPSDVLVLGRAYRLVTTQEVMKVLRAKKLAKMKKNIESEMDLPKQSSSESIEDKNHRAMGHDGRRQRSRSTNLAATKPKSWQPSLRSISESGNSIE